MALSLDADESTAPPVISWPPSTAPLSAEGWTAKRVRGTGSEAVVALAWIEEEPTTGASIAALSWGADTPTDHRLSLEPPDATPRAIEIAADDKGTLHAVWQGPSLDGFLIGYTRVNPDGSLAESTLDALPPDQEPDAICLTTDRPSGATAAAWLVRDGATMRLRWAGIDALNGITYEELPLPKPASYIAYPHLWRHLGAWLLAWYEADTTGRWTARLAHRSESGVWSFTTVDDPTLPANRLPLLMSETREHEAAPHLAAVYSESEPGAPSRVLRWDARTAESTTLSAPEASAGWPRPLVGGDDAGATLTWPEDAGTAWRLVMRDGENGPAWHWPLTVAPDAQPPRDPMILTHDGLWWLAALAQTQVRLSPLPAPQP